MAVIDDFRGIVTVFVEFKIDQKKSDLVINQLKEFYDKHAKGSQGLVSVNYHLSFDKSSIFNYAQWKTEEDFDNFITNESNIEFMKTIDCLESRFTKTKVVFTT
ncbi:MAG: quinol monooxygenase YgiN [Bacteriovoracaceae bacterium]|jgi:quinol monooxygenase YgiN